MEYTEVNVVCPYFKAEKKHLKEQEATQNDRPRMTEVLLPCKRCGGDPIMKEIPFIGYGVRCPACDEFFSVHGTEQQATDWWNDKNDKEDDNG